MDRERYVERYAAPLASSKRAVTGEVREFDPRHFEPPDVGREAAPLTLSQLFVAGALCGHAEARAELGRRSDAADRDLATLDEARRRRDAAGDGIALGLIEAERQLAALGQRTRALEESAQASRRRIGEIESSTTWRMTAPLRSGVHRVKIVAAAVQTQWRAARQLPRHAGTALTILRNDGAAALARRAMRKLRARPRLTLVGDTVESSTTAPRHERVRPSLPTHAPSSRRHRMPFHECSRR